MAERPFKSGLLLGFRHAIDGVCYVLRTERNARIHFVVAAIVIALAAWVQLTTLEWALVILAIALVFAGEMINTVTELVVDMITQEYHPLAKYAKDVAAGTILVAAIDAAAVGILVLGPRLWCKLAEFW